MQAYKLLVIFLSIGTFCAAQPDTAHWSGDDVVVGNTYYTYGNNVSLRKSPGVDAEKIATLSINKPVEILEISETQFPVYELDRPWVKVKTSEIEGYLASGLLSLRRIELVDGSYLLYTRALDSDKNETKVKLRRVIDNRIVEIGTYELGVANFNVKLHNSRGLKNIDHVLELDFLAEACGQNGGNSLFAIDTYVDQPIFLGSFESIGDGGLYHASEKLVFPDDPDGMEGMIIYEGEEGEEDEQGVYRTVSKRKSYAWSDIANGLKIRKFVYN